MTLTPDLHARLKRLAQIAQKAAIHLQASDRALFEEPMTPGRAEYMGSDTEHSDRLEAFVSRFSRLQDMLGDKLLPHLLAALGETPRSSLDNLDRAERLGWINSSATWFRIRALRNLMVHDYIDDPRVLADALNSAHDFIPFLLSTARAMHGELEHRGWL